jgi:4'-phosphopantetheinyl transferase
MVTGRDRYLVAAGVVCAVQSHDQILASLPVDRADQRATASMAAWRATEYLAARTLLRSLLAETAPEFATTVISQRPSGQPFLPACRQLGVSLSHSKDWAAAAVGIRCAVGVDVQEPEHVDQKLVDRFFAPADAATLAALPPADREREIAWIWTVLEACVKADGTGLAVLPRQLPGRRRSWQVPVPPFRPEGMWMGLTWFSLRQRSAVPAACAYGPLRSEGEHGRD